MTDKFSRMILLCFKDFFTVLKRSPVLASVACLTGIVGTIMVEMPNHMKETRLVPFFFALIFIEIALLSLEITSEIRTFGRSVKHSLNAAAILLGAGVYAYLPSNPEPDDSLRYGLWCLAVALPAGFLLFWKQGNSEFQRRFFTRVIGSAFIASVTSMALFCLAVGAILGIDSLLVDIPREGLLVPILGIIAFLSLAPILSLTFVRANNGFHATWDKVSQGFALYIFAPGVIIYEAILLVYAIKIMVLQSLPKGTVSALVSVCVCLAVTLAILIPNTQAKHWHRFQKLIFAILVPLLALELIAISERVSEYGITHLRYLLIVSAACQSLIVLWQLIRGSDTMPAFSSIIFIAAIVASMGPLGFAPVSLRSQYSGFLKLLEEEKLINSGVWQTASQEPQFEIRLQLTDKLAWLEQHGGRDLVSALLPEPARDKWTKPPQCNSDPCQYPSTRAKNFEDLLKFQGLQPTYRFNSPDPNEEKTEISLNNSSIIQLKPNTYVASVACSEYSSTGVHSGDLFINSENNCQDIILSRGAEPLCRISGLASHLTKNSTANKPGIEIIDEKCRWRIIFQDYRHTLIKGSTEPKKTYYRATLWLEIEK